MSLFVSKSFAFNTLDDILFKKSRSASCPHLCESALYREKRREELLPTHRWFAVAYLFSGVHEKIRIKYALSSRYWFTSTGQYKTIFTFQYYELLQAILVHHKIYVPVFTNTGAFQYLGPKIRLFQNLHKRKQSQDGNHTIAVTLATMESPHVTETFF